MCCHGGETQWAGQAGLPAAAIHSRPVPVCPDGGTTAGTHPGASVTPGPQGEFLAMRGAVHGARSSTVADGRG